MKPEDEWAGQFGDDYHARNWVQWTERIPFWLHIINLTNARSVFEMGCGPGWNLSAIRRAFPDVSVTGSDLNDTARDIALAADLGVDSKTPIQDSDWADRAELVFTAGCLIHIPPDEIMDVMENLVWLSYKYVLCIEYESAKEEEIEYRGQQGLLWKRPYRAMYEELGLTEVAFGRVGPEDGFDNCVWGLMSK